VATDSAEGPLGLSTHVVSSNIPRADQADPAATWDFPSPQRFYDAMRKKGYEPEARDIPSVVSIHNTVNEQVWREILRWESMHAECARPQLRKFGRVFGRPEDLSPKARVLQWLGFGGLFDRHDWHVDRCGTSVRYVIDFWALQPRADGRPAIHLDARPALDSFPAFFDRARFFISPPPAVAAQPQVPPPAPPKP
jgi:cytochrome c heme-lyase